MNRLRKQTDKHVGTSSRVPKNTGHTHKKGMAAFSYKPLQNPYLP